MAYVKFIKARGQSSGGMHGSMEYCKREQKTWDKETQRHLVTGVNCMADMAFQEFMNTKRLYGKTDGRMYYHVIQSFNPEERLSPETAHEIALKLAEEFVGHGLHLEIKVKAPFQNHTDTYANGVLTNRELEEIIQGVGV